MTISIDVREKDLNLMTEAYISTYQQQIQHGLKDMQVIEMFCAMPQVHRIAPVNAKQTEYLYMEMIQKVIAAFIAFMPDVTVFLTLLQTLLLENRAKCGVHFSINLLITPNP